MMEFGEPVNGRIGRAIRAIQNQVAVRWSRFLRQTGAHFAENAPPLTCHEAPLRSGNFIRILRERLVPETRAEGAIAPKTLRQKDRRRMKLWKAASP